LRCDANVSLRPVGQAEFGTRSELKNLNSFRFVQRAIDVEVARQTAILDAGGTIEQETRAFDPDTGKTRSLRSKEDAHDYRYFPEPDLPPLAIDVDLVERERARVGELPAAVRTRWIGLGLTPATAQTLSAHPETVRFFEAVRERFDRPVKIANFVMTEVLRGADLHGIRAKFSVTPEQVAELLELVESGKISGKQAKDVFTAVEGSAARPADVVRERGIEVVSNAGELEAICGSLVAEHPDQVKSYRAGKKNMLGFFVGQVMKQTKGSADPRLVNALLTKLLEG
jgi:aspartyl-tRNA(Asn)/glutamyl-tRNA(Gln) amidotransferase subunit B